MRLAYVKPCGGCGNDIYIAICRDGRWRPFEMDEHPPAPAGVWAWRKRHGMEETDLVRGHLLHLCADYHLRFDPLAVTA